MDKNNQKKEYIFDADGKKFGRMLTEVVTVLRGKNEPNFKSNSVPNVKVIINNASKVVLNKSQLEKEYKRYSGYPGGLTHESREHLIKRKGYRDIFEKAIYGMLPNNKLRSVIMKNLTVNE